MQSIQIVLCSTWWHEKFTRNAQALFQNGSAALVAVMYTSSRRREEGFDITTRAAQPFSSKLKWAGYQSEIVHVTFRFAWWPDSYWACKTSPHFILVDKDRGPVWGELFTILSLHSLDRDFQNLKLMSLMVREQPLLMFTFVRYQDGH